MELGEEWTKEGQERINKYPKKQFYDFVKETLAQKIKEEVEIEKVHSKIFQKKVEEMIKRGEKPNIV